MDENGDDNEEEEEEDAATTLLRVKFELELGVKGVSEFGVLPVDLRSMKAYRLICLGSFGKLLLLVSNRGGDIGGMNRL